MKPKGPKPLFMTVDNIVKYYGVDKGKAARIAKRAGPVGVHTGNTLYNRRDIEEQIKKG